MKTKGRRWLLAAVAVLVVSVPATVLVVGKGHVPAHKDQVCHKGRALDVGIAAVAGHERHGDCRLPINDPKSIFFRGDACSAKDCVNGVD